MQPESASDGVAHASNLHGRWSPCRWVGGTKVSPVADSPRRGHFLGPPGGHSQDRRFSAAAESQIILLEEFEKRFWAPEIDNPFLRSPWRKSGVYGAARGLCIGQNSLTFKVAKKGMKVVWRRTK